MQLTRISATLRALGRDTSGNSLIEFAYALPILVTLGMYGVELAYMATVNMQVNQIAVSVADNASRIGQTDNSAVSPTIRNPDIDSVMDGAMQQGSVIDIQNNGRIILSSLERNPTTGRQYIHWQKCRGALVQNSAYGPAGYGSTGAPITGLGKPVPVAAGSGSAVMFVEVFYTYKPLFGQMFVKNVKFNQEFKFIIRDDRDLESGVPNTPAGRSECT